MVCGIALEKNRCPNEEELVTAIKRNFDGLESLDSVDEFKKYLPEYLPPVSANTVSSFFSKSLKRKLFLYQKVMFFAMNQE